MEPIYWYALAYAVGTGMGYYFGRTSVDQVVSATIATLIESGYVKTREDANGDLDLVKLTFEERLDDTKSDI